MQVLGWSVTIGADGQRVCTPPGGRALGWAEVRERERPLVPFRDLAERRMQALRAEGVSGLSVERARRLVTTEGELGAITTITGTRDDEPVEHGLAVIYTDEFQVTIDGRAARADQRAAVRAVVHELAMNLPVGLGERRYRRFWYRPPAGWQGLPRGLVTNWYPPDFPHNSAWIKVLPARPFRQPVSVVQIDSLIHDDSFTSFVPERRLVRGDGDFGGFTTVITRVVGRFTQAARDDSRRMLITAALTDGRYVYCLRLDTGEEKAAVHEQLFLDLVKTAVPIQSPRPAQMSETLTHWAE